MKCTLIKSLPVIVPIILLEGCSYQAGYTTLHNIAKNECRKIINPEERHQCEIRHNGTDYKAYRYEYEKD